MKFLDRIVLTVDKPEYAAEGVTKGTEGVIVISESRKATFMVEFMRDTKTISIMPVYVGDIQLVEASDVTDEDILEDLPSNDPSWWCKVEDGYIINLKGERKNKIPYDYRS